MQDDKTKKPDQSDKNDRTDKVEDLRQKPIAESDAQAVKGGRKREDGIKR